MGKYLARTASFSVLVLFLLAGKVASRYLHYHAAESVSDGVSVGVGQDEESFLQLKGMDSSKEHCELMYGFLPCATNIQSRIFLIVIYEYLLYQGESYAGGDGRIFVMFGDNFFVAIFSQLLDSLPEALILLAAALTSSKEKAQDYVVTGVGLLAGSSIFLLTLLWGVCFICGTKKFYVKPDSKVKSEVKKEEKNRAILLLTGSGVVTDAETRDHAKVMFISLVPLVVILYPRCFGFSSSVEELTIVIGSLIMSVICLCGYFYYQKTHPWMRNRRQEYAEVERKVEMNVPFYEVQALIVERERHLMSKQKEMAKSLKEPNGQKIMTREEFYDIFETWIDETRKLMDDPYSVDTSRTEYNEVAKLLLKEKKKLIELISDMMDHASDKKLVTEDGAVDESSIDKFFKQIDENGDDLITPSELKDYIMKVHGDKDKLPVDDETAEIMMRILDIDGNKTIDQEEFKSGITRWLKEINLVRNHGKKKSDGNQKPDNNVVQKPDRYRQGKAKEKLEEKSDGNQKPDINAVQKPDKYHEGKAKAKLEEMLKVIALLVAGTVMLLVLAEPLVESVRQFSESVNIEPFYVSFILIPLATKARTAIAAIRAASQKRHLTTSLTFSEIYHKVFMNNILCFLVLISVILFRGLTWHFSAEIIVVITVCTIMGLLTSFKSKFPNWTLLIAFPLYPLSLVMVYFLGDTFQAT